MKRFLLGAGVATIVYMVLDYVTYQHLVSKGRL